LTSFHGNDRKELTKAELRKFGLTVGGAFIVLFGFVLPWIFSFGTPIWPFVLGGTLVAPALIAPSVLRPVHTVWMWVALKVGAFNSRVLLGVLFYLVFTPVGLVRRAFGADPMGVRDPGVGTYRKPSHPRSPQSFERPF